MLRYELFDCETNPRLIGPAFVHSLTMFGTNLASRHRRPSDDALLTPLAPASPVSTRFEVPWTSVSATRQLTPGCGTLGASSSDQAESPGPDDAPSAEPDCIQVFIRVRPTDRTLPPHQRAVAVETARTLSVQGGGRMRFSRIFEQEDNEEIFQHVGRPLVRSVLDGYNGTLMAYGQTGSGKTYTLGEAAHLGTAHAGLSPRILRQLMLKAEGMRGREVRLRMQCVQVYLEKIYDVLGEGAGGGAESVLSLREDQHLGLSLVGATTLTLTSIEQGVEPQSNTARPRLRRRG